MVMATENWSTMLRKSLSTDRSNDHLLFTDPFFGYTVALILDRIAVLYARRPKALRTKADSADNDSTIKQKPTKQSLDHI